MVHSSPEMDFLGGIKFNKNKNSDRSFGRVMCECCWTLAAQLIYFVSDTNLPVANLLQPDKVSRIYWLLSWEDYLFGKINRHLADVLLAFPVEGMCAQGESVGISDITDGEFPFVAASCC